jgi:hypothetical protein
VIPSWIWSLGHIPAWLLVAAHVALQVFFVGRAVLRPHREPASRLAWVVVIIVAPVVGMLAYVLFGETNIGRRRIARLRAAMERLPPFADIGRHTAENEAASVPQRYLPLFRVGQSISFFPVVDGNRGELLGDSDDVIDHIVRDIVNKIAGGDRRTEMTQIHLFIAPVADNRLVHLTQDRSIQTIHPVKLLVCFCAEVSIMVPGIDH